MSTGIAAVGQDAQDARRSDRREPPTRSPRKSTADIVVEAVTEPETEWRPSAGRVVAGRYRLERLMARGGTSAVYEAVHVVTLKRFALKLMHPSLGVEAQGSQRFLREARAPAAVGHEGIVDVLDAGIDDEDGTVFLAMECLAGESLSAYMAREDVTRLDVLERIAEVLDPLGAAHARGFVHRDLKPANVFIVSDAKGRPSVKLLDFGIARVESEGITHTGAFLGTFGYVSPEQARSPNAATPAADVWSIGAMIYKACAGQPPFGTDAGALVAAATKAHVPLVAVDPSIPPRLSALVDRCLAKHPDDRPGSVEELGRALAAILADERDSAALRARAMTRPSLVARLAALREAGAESGVATELLERSTVVTARKDARAGADEAMTKLLAEPRPSAPTTGRERKRTTRYAGLVLLVIVAAALLVFALTGSPPSARRERVTPLPVESPRVVPDPQPAPTRPPLSAPAPAVVAAPEPAPELAPASSPARSRAKRAHKQVRRQTRETTFGANGAPVLSD